MRSERKLHLHTVPIALLLVAVFIVGLTFSVSFKLFKSQGYTIPVKSAGNELGANVLTIKGHAALNATQPQPQIEGGQNLETALYYQTTNFKY